MPLRYLAIEAYVDSDRVQMQLLNAHQSVSAAYWHYPPNFTRLFLIDLRRGSTHSWRECERMMFVEQLQRVQEGKRLEMPIVHALSAAGYIGANGDISDKGRDFLAEYARENLSLVLPYMHSTSTLNLKG
jgi:hypothetical protein